MKKYIIYSIVAFLIVALTGGGFYLYQKRNQKSAPDNVSTDPETIPDNQEQENTQPDTQPVEVAPKYVYPIDNFAARITKNDFGQYFPVGGTTNPDRAVCPSATYYSGYHTANDLEAFPSELNLAVPVKSIAAGTVRRVGPVSGYGGLIVIEYDIGGSIYTAYFGHVNLSTATVKTGDVVTPSEHIVDLAPQCSSTNGNVRKHLHFGLHEGSAIDVSGYVSGSGTLSNWVDPKALLSSLGAK